MAQDSSRWTIIARAAGPTGDGASVQARYINTERPTDALEGIEKAVRDTYREVHGEEVARFGIATLPYVKSEDEEDDT